MQTDAKIMLSDDKLLSLSERARKVYLEIYDYCTYSADPQYNQLHQYRRAINRLAGPDRDILIQYFNSDPAIRWPGIPQEPWHYYKKPY